MQCFAKLRGHGKCTNKRDNHPGTYSSTLEMIIKLVENLLPKLAAFRCFLRPREFRARVICTANLAQAVTFDSPPGDGKNRSSGCQEDEKVGKAAGSAGESRQRPSCGLNKDAFCLGSWDKWGVPTAHFPELLWHCYAQVRGTELLFQLLELQSAVGFYTG